MNNNQITYYKDKSNFVWSIVILFVIIFASTIVLFSENYSNEIKLVTLFVFWLYAFLFGLKDFANRYAFTTFVFMIYVFLLSRPTLAFLYGVDWEYWKVDTISSSFKIIYISLLSLVLSCAWASIPKCTNDTCKQVVLKNENSILINYFATFLLIACGLSFVYLRMTTYFTYSGADYASLYLDRGYGATFLIRAFGQMFPLAISLYLALMPSKLNTILAMALYVVGGIPVFLLGNRASLVLPIVFVTVYYLAREYTEEERGKWVSKGLIVMFSVFVIGALFVLGAMNYTRSGTPVLQDAKMPLLADFFYKQGTTFDTVCQGIEYRDRLESLPGDPQYTFGGIIDTLRYSRAGRFLNNIEALPGGNTLDNVYKKNSLAHRLSFAVLGHLYLLGYGRGSSYMLENYLDWGLIGVAVVNVALGLFLSNINALLKKRSLLGRTITICCLTQVYILPRSDTTSFLAFLVEPYFWLVACAIFTMTVIVGKQQN